MKLPSWFIGPMVMADETEIHPMFGKIEKIQQKRLNWQTRTRNGKGLFNEVSCKARQIWQTENPEKGITGSCPEGSEISLDPTGETTIIEMGVVTGFWEKCETANPDGLDSVHGCM